MRARHAFSSVSSPSHAAWKVKGHATDDDVLAGKVSDFDRVGNARVDKLCDVAALSGFGSDLCALAEICGR